MKDIARTYIQRDGTLSSLCPHCGASNVLTIDTVQSIAGSIDVQCSCGRKYSFLAEFRKAYRRPMNLTGIYRKVSANEEQGGILIENMSMTGIGFSTAGSHSMKPGDQVLLQFVLMDENRTGMEIVATVVRVGETMIGCSFQSLSPEQEEALASFFMGIL